MPDIEIEKEEEKKVSPIRSIVSIKDLRRLENQFFALSSKSFKDGQEQSKKYNDELMLRYEAALVKGVRGDKFTKPKSKSRVNMIKHTRKLNRGVKGRSQKQGK